MGKRRIQEAIPEAMLVEILARLPLRSIARLKSVCKRWKSVIESSYFRRLFVSLHRNSSSSWSLMFGRPITEAIGFHGCKTWDLPKSPGSYIMPFQPYPNLPTSNYHYVASSNGLILIGVLVENLGDIHKYLVCNPVLQQWVEIPPLPTPPPRPPPPPPNPRSTCFVRVSGLVTRVEEDGFVSSFKVVMTCQMFGPRDSGVYVYSSETGLWTFKRLVNYDGFMYHMNHNGMLYMWGFDLFGIGPGLLVAHDFYGPEDDDQCRVIPLPLPLPYNIHVRRCLTTSGGDVIYIELLYQRLKVWKLKNNNFSDGECWHLSREEINMAASVGFDVDCFPMGANPFDSDIVYLWSRQHGCLVSGNLRTQEFIFHQESENWSSSEDCCVVNTLESKGCMEGNCKENSVLMLSQLVLPQWMDPLPRPPN